IKPHNVLIGPEGRLKVTDFGIARSGASQMTEVGSIIGTAQYLSPEQARGAPVDQTSDLYSVGVVLYELLTGQVPFTGETPLEIAMKHLSEVPKPPSELRPEVPHDLDLVVLRALAKDPADRYPTADLALGPRGPAARRRGRRGLVRVHEDPGPAQLEQDGGRSARQGPARVASGSEDSEREPRAPRHARDERDRREGDRLRPEPERG